MAGCGHLGLVSLPPKACRVIKQVKEATHMTPKMQEIDAVKCCYFGAYYLSPGPRNN